MALERHTWANCFRFFAIGNREPLNVICQRSLLLRVVLLKISGLSMEAQLRQRQEDGTLWHSRA